MSGRLVPCRPIIGGESPPELNLIADTLQIVLGSNPDAPIVEKRPQLLASEQILLQLSANPFDL